MIIMNIECDNFEISSLNITCTVVHYRSLYILHSLIMTLTKAETCSYWFSVTHNMLYLTDIYWFS